MKRFLNKLLILILIISNVKSDTDKFVFGKTHFSARPQDQNVARKMMGVEDKIHLFGENDFYGVLSTASEFQTTFDSKKIGKYFSFVKNSNSMTYDPMNTTDKCGKFDINSTTFGTGASGVICFKPRIYNFIYDVDLWVGLDKILCGLWSRLMITLAYTNWNMRLSDTGENGDRFIPVNGAQLKFPYENIFESFKGGSDVEVIAQNGGTTIIHAASLKNGKIDGKRSETGVAGIHYDLGYDFISRENGHLGASIHVVFPTGNDVNDLYLFNSVLGTNNWQLGMTLNGSYRLWQNCDRSKELSLYFDAVATHLFKHRQKRLFGIKNFKPGSEYLIVADATESEDNPFIERFSNIVICEKKFGNTIMLDAALMLQYDTGCYSFGLGYNLWLRSKDKISSKSCKNCLATDKKYELQGDIDFCLANTNPEITQLTNNDIDFCVALHPSSLTNKIFGFMEYNWKNKKLQPYLLLGAEVEWARGNKAANQAGIIFKGGISF